MSTFVSACLRAARQYDLDLDPENPAYARGYALGVEDARRYVEGVLSGATPSDVADPRLVELCSRLRRIVMKLGEITAELDGL
jgi:hypothetical protein